MGVFNLTSISCSSSSTSTNSFAAVNMKVFVVSALLVACVAGQSLDTYRPFNRDLISRKGLSTYNYNRPSNYHYGGDYSNNMVNTDYNNDYMTSIYNKIFGGDVDYSTTSTSDYMNVMSYEEITSHPLFREYMGLPLFRQFWSYPMFQRYVCSHYFQRYWTMPAFQQYFMEPTLFYKYIYPIVQLFKYEQTSMNTYTTGESDMIYGGNRRNFYPFAGGSYYNNQEYQPQQQYYGNGNGLPTVCYTNSMYCRSLVQNLYNHMMYTSKMMTPESMMTPTSGMDYSDMYKYNPYFGKMMYPTMYSNVYNKEFQNFEVPRKTIVNDDMIRPYFSTPVNKAMIGDKTVPTMPVDQIIKA